MTFSFSHLLYHATLEKELLETFPKPLFEQLNLPSSTHLQIYQKLPRFSTPEYPNHLLVKKEFSDLAILKRKCLDKALLSLYASYSPSQAHHILLLTYVIPGGLGDFFTQKSLQALLKKAFPSLNITTLSFVHMTAPLCLSKKEEKNSLEDHILRFSSLEDLRKQLFSEKYLSLMKTASLILQIPTLYPDWDLLITALENYLNKGEKTPRIETIGEYGFINSKDFYPTTDARCLGLHFLEYGLLLDPPSQEPSTPFTFPHEHVLPKRKDNIRLFFAYLCTEYGHSLYLYTLLLYLKEDSQDIVLYTPDIGLFLKAIHSAEEFFKDVSLKNIHIYYKDKYSCLSIQEEGKHLYLIHTGSLDHQTFKQYLSRSEEPIGIRGNRSLSEVISLNKTYFYDLLDHNTNLYEGLLAIASATMPHAAQLLRLYKPSKQHTALEAAYLCVNLMTHTPALEELRLLNKKIQEEHSANTHLENLVARSLMLYENPSLEAKERDLIAHFIDKTISFEDLILSLRKSLALG
jgi:hypothetical protein